MKMKVFKTGNVFLVTVEEIQFMIKIQPHGFQSTVIRQGEPVEVENVSAHEDELLELVHEKLLELMLNEISGKLFPNSEELVSLLDNMLNENNLEEVVKEGMNASKYIH